METINRKKRIFTIIQVGSRSDIPSRIYDIALVVAVLVNIFIALFETFPQSAPFLLPLRITEGITVVFFTIDYILRIWTASYLYRGVSVSRARIKFACRTTCHFSLQKAQSFCACSVSSGFCASSAFSTMPIRSKPSPLF